LVLIMMMLADNTNLPLRIKGALRSSLHLNAYGSLWRYDLQKNHHR
jgi:hypothetical protein